MTQAPGASRLVAFCVFFVFAGFALTQAARADDAAVKKRGEYLFAAAGCAGCHTDVDGKGPPLAGGRKLKTPFGTFYSANITRDPEHGIGDWTDADFIRALREGIAPDGSHYFPAFPYPTFTKIRDADLKDIRAYIFSLPPVAKRNQSHDIDPPFGWRPLIAGWKLLFFAPGPFAANPDRDETWNRGAYLVEALGHCGECHTPRNALGALKRDEAFSGTLDGPEGGRIPNITPDADTGIGRWSDGDIKSLFTMGMLPDGDFVGSGMAEVVENTTSKLTDADRDAIIVYLRSLPPLSKRIESAK